MLVALSLAACTLSDMQPIIARALKSVAHVAVIGDAGTRLET